MPHLRAPLRTLLLWAGAAVVVAAFAVFGLAGRGGSNGRNAPSLPSEQLSGSKVTVAALRGRPAIVTFWASWCGPCAQEAPALERFSEGLGHRGMLVGVNYEDPSLSEALTFLKRYRWTFPNLRDPEGIVGRHYGVATLPSTFVIDGAGKLRATLRGPQTQQTLTGALASVGG